MNRQDLNLVTITSTPTLSHEIKAIQQITYVEINGSLINVFSQKKKAFCLTLINVFLLSIVTLNIN